MCLDRVIVRLEQAEMTGWKLFSRPSWSSGLLSLYRSNERGVPIGPWVEMEWRKSSGVRGERIVTPGQESYEAGFHACLTFPDAELFRQATSYNHVIRKVRLRGVYTIGVEDYGATMAMGVIPVVVAQEAMLLAESR